MCDESFLGKKTKRTHVVGEIQSASIFVVAGCERDLQEEPSAAGEVRHGQVPAGHGRGSS